MRIALKSILVVALALLVAVPAMAQDDAAKKKRKKNQEQTRQQVGAPLKKQLAKASLTEEQTKKIEGIFAEYSPKLKEVAGKLALTDEQKSARKDATAKADAEGLKGRQKTQAVNAAMSLTEDQKKAQGEQRQLNASLREAVIAVLTADQQEVTGLKARKAKKDK